nr:hypothetical protein [Enterococcus faecalis]
MFFYYSTLFDSRFKTLQQNQEELVIALVWQDNFFTYNKEEVESKLNKMEGISTTIKLAIYQFIEKTNYLLYLSYKELH